MSFQLSLHIPAYIYIILQTDKYKFEDQFINEEVFIKSSYACILKITTDQQVAKAANVGWCALNQFLVITETKVV